jgi:membrane-bound serine protease (ClpP class)
VLGLGGVAALAMGCVILIDSESPGWGIPLPLVGAVALVSGVFVLLVAGMAARSRRRPVVSGPHTLVGTGGEVVEYAGDRGWALVQGEHWKVHGPPGLRPGDRVRVTGLRDGVLEVGPA